MPHQYDEDYVNQRYEVMNLKVFHTRFKTGFEESRDLVFRSNDLVAGRYQVILSRKLHSMSSGLDMVWGMSGRIPDAIDQFITLLQKILLP